MKNNINFHRYIETLSIIVFPILTILVLYTTISVLIESQLLWLSLGFIFISWLLADWVTGIVHWFCDNYGSESMSYIGPAIIQPFREHHIHPGKICEHDFIETNGNSFLLGVVVLGPIYYGIHDATAADFGYALAALSATATALFSILANQFHKWAHISPELLAHKPILRFCQKIHLCLNPEHHRQHHKPPFSRSYCISCGWMNPVLDWLNFFGIIQKFLSFFGIHSVQYNQTAKFDEPTID